MKYALFWDITQRWVVFLYRRLWTTYRSHLQGLRSPNRKAWPLKIGPIGCPEASVRNYHSTLHNIPEERNRGGILKSRIQEDHHRITNSYLWFHVRIFGLILYNLGYFSLLKGRAMALAQADSRLLFTAAARVRSQVGSYEVCGGQSGTGTGFFPEYFGFPLSLSFH
jgi:hypothetical protein